MSIDFDSQTSMESYSFGDSFDQVKGPPSWILIFSIVSASLGGIIALVTFASAFDLIHGVEAPAWAGLIGYVLTLLIPATLVAHLRNHHTKSSKENPDNYDSYLGLKIAKRLSKVALIGFILSLFAIYVLVRPLAEAMAT